MTFSTPIHTNTQSIDRVLRAGLPVLLVFWRPDSQPSTQLNPALDRLAQSYAGKLLIAKINVQDNAELTQRYSVRQLPSLRYVKDGQVLAEASGAAPEASLRSWLDAALSGNAVPSLTGASTPLHKNAQSGAKPAQAGSTSQPGAQTHATNGAAHPLVLTDATFDQVIRESKLPVLVDFWAPWCGPCRMIAPTVEQLAREFAGRAVVAKVNTDEQQRIAQRYGIMSIPALFIFKGGQVVERLVGVQPASVLRQALQRHVGY